MSEWTLKEKSTGELVVTIEGDEWKKDVEKAFSKLGKNVTMNGFRKGQVPKKLLEHAIPERDRELEAVNDNANAWLKAALDEQKLEPISQPTLDLRSIDPEKVVVVFEFAVKPEATVSDYKGLDYHMDDTSVSEEEFNKEIDRMRENFADMENKDGEAENGDTVDINYEGFKDGVPFDGGKAENYNLELGSGSFIPGFEDQLVGVKAGDEKELNLKFPEDYHSKDLAGQDVVFKVKVNEVKHKVLPEVDDDFAKDVNAKGVETAEDLKKMVRERLENQKKQSAEDKGDNDLLDQLLAKTEVEIPDVMVEDEVNGRINQIAAQVQQYGMKLESYLSMMGKTLDQLKKDYEEESRKTVKTRLALDAVAKAEKLEPTDAEIEKEFSDIAAQYGLSVDRVKAAISKAAVQDQLREDKAFRFVKKNANGAPEVREPETEAPAAEEGKDASAAE